jgi:hypothetical protein
MQGRADKGIIITTGAFTSEEKKKLCGMVFRRLSWSTAKSSLRCLKI